MTWSTKEFVSTMFWAAINAAIAGFILGGSCEAKRGSAAVQAAHNECEERVQIALDCGACTDQVIECGELVCVPGAGWVGRSK